MNNTSNLALWISIAALIPGIYSVISGIRKRWTDQVAEQHVVRSALELLEPYRKEKSRLDEKLEKAGRTITVLTEQLDKVTRRAKDLDEQLAAARAEVGYLRIQVDSLTSQLQQQNGG